MLLLMVLLLLLLLKLKRIAVFAFDQAGRSTPSIDTTTSSATRFRSL
jgi:hypothetical protein